MLDRLLPLLIGCVLLAGCHTVHNPVKPANPQRFQQEIDAMLARDRELAPRQDAIVFAGSSSVKNWTNHLAEDMAPLPVVNRGFGGSQTHDQLHYMDQIILPLRPRVIVYYCGDNDLANPRVPAEAVTRNFQAFCARVWARSPETRILFMSIKPSPAREARWPEMRKANRQIRHWSWWTRRVEFVDLTSTLLPSPGQFRLDRFEADRLHVNREGYRAWAEVLRPRVAAAWHAVGGEAR